MFFDCLYDEDVISEDAFYQWETSKDPAEQQGKGVALKSVTAFFTWLREAEEESEDNWHKRVADAQRPPTDANYKMHTDYTSLAIDTRTPANTGTLTLKRWPTWAGTLYDTEGTLNTCIIYIENIFVLKFDFFFFCYF